MVPDFFRGRSRLKRDPATNCREQARHTPHVMGYFCAGEKVLSAFREHRNLRQQHAYGLGPESMPPSVLDWSLFCTRYRRIHGIRSQQQQVESAPIATTVLKANV